MRGYIFFIFCLVQLSCLPEQEGTDLLADIQLNHMIQRGGNAVFELKDGVLIGKAKMNTPNSFLCTKENYSNFVLDFSVSIDPRLNSGVQIRSEVFNYQGQEALKGYQVEIDPSERAWSGGLYEESNRGWISNLANNESGRAAFRNGRWNHYHIEAIDSSIRVWVNDVNTCNLLDSLCKSGVIGFQVHSIADERLTDAMVQWKDIHLYTHDLDRYTRADINPSIERNLLVNELSKSEKEHGWKTSSVLQHLIQASSDGSACFDSISRYNVQSNMGYNFEMKFEYRISEGGQAEFIYGSDERTGAPMGFSITDDYHVTADLPKHDYAGSLSGKLSAQNLSNPGAIKPLRNHNQWSQATIVWDGNSLQHWLNGNLVVDYVLKEGQQPGENIYLLLKDATACCIRSVKWRKVDKLTSE